MSSPSSEAIPFDRSLAAKPEAVQRVSPLVRRVIANNGGPFTFTGTCSYIIGDGDVAIIDPGPADARHRDALLDAVRDETVRHILVTHAHRDHAPGAAALRAATGAVLLGCRPHREEAGARDGVSLDTPPDGDYVPDTVLVEGDRVSGPGYDLVTVETPGHTSGHLAFALPQERSLLSGDHVMAWSTTVVAPPDGSMRDYRASLHKLLGRDDDTYWPGHGGPVREPRRYVRALALHRRQREAAILARIVAGDATVATIAAHVYRGLAPALRGAAAMSVLAHLEELVVRGVAVADGPVTLKGRYAPA